ncbi:glutamine amidotransferase [Moorella sp. Hama-1]|uniref:glutamine amidotransferase n=1 Tax=Moorella sp. Hama-1 TaxID=2138101 RepID=UPI000D64B990|nr:glutamine amidotransferase [Moorella sp. Hama-1]BCV20302.1 hypothetical protein hamaS1_03710 [Moorella sp. Hama-1]
MRILFAGESWVTHMIHIKGFDSFTTSKYEEGAKWLLEALQGGGMEVDFQPSHVAQDNFPFTGGELKKYHAVILSDIGSNTLLLHNDTFGRSIVLPNRLETLRRYVEEGGGLVMIGGYMSFSGIDGKARYGETPLAAALPVECLNGDDRCEVPEGITPKVVQPGHPLLAGVPGAWPHFLGYNRFRAKAEAEVLLTAGEDPFLVVQNYGRGRSLAFASDCAPHWGPPEFLNWPGYKTFWVNALRWVAREL